MSLYPDIDRLDTLTFGGLKNGLTTLRHLLKKLGNPQDTFKVFHIAGTNGKGSVCQMLSQILWKSFGYKVGLTISPHLIKVNERVQINGIMISDKDLNSYLNHIYTLIKDEQLSLSFFEHMILVAFLYFRDQQVDYAVIEVGLGGKYDATNVFSSPVATLLTTISDDHRDILGPSLQQIFWNKAGILKKNVPCFTRLDTPLMHYAAKIKNAPLRVAKERKQTNLLGEHQQDNAGLVAYCLKTLGFNSKDIETGLMHITNPGRCQRIRPNILIDGAHNEEGIRAFAAYVNSIKGRYTHVVTVFGSTKSREDYPRFFSHLLHGDTNYFITPAIAKRGISPTTYQQHLSFKGIDAGTREEVHKILPRDDEETLIIVYGSLYLIGECIQTYTQQ